MSTPFRIVAIVALLALAGYAWTSTACACARAHRDGEPSERKATAEPRSSGDVRCPADDPDCRSGNLDRLRAAERAAQASDRQAAEASRQ